MLNSGSGVALLLNLYRERNYQEAITQDFYFRIGAGMNLICISVLPILKSY